MPRLLDVFYPFPDVNGQPTAGGYVKCFENETAIELKTYNDVDETIPNPAQIPLNGEGRLDNNVYVSVTATVAWFNSDDVQQDSRDNVIPRGGIGSADTYPDWNNTTEWLALNSIVVGSDGLDYRAQKDSVNVDPVADFAAGGEFWKRTNLNVFWTEHDTYAQWDRVTSPINNRRYISSVDSNLNNEPTTGVKWQLDENWLPYDTDRPYLSGDTSTASNNRRYVAVIDTTGNDPVGDDGTNWLPTDGIVTAPTNTLPADTATNVSRTPTLTSSAYTITGGTGVHEWSLWDVATDSGFTAIVDTSDITRDLESYTVVSVLDSATTYYMRVAYKGVRTDISTFSSTTSFTTTPSLSEIFAINSETGTGALRTTVTGVDLSTASGSIHLKNRDTTGFIKRLDTSRNLNELDLAEETIQAANANGLQQYFVNGFETGTDASYNNSGDTISSFVFKNAAGFHDTVQYTGDNTNRNIAHSLGVEVGAYIVKNTSALSVGNTGFWFRGKDMTTTFSFDMAGGSNSAPTLGGATTTTFNVQASVKTNNTGDTYICEVFAHNPVQGIFCGTYTGTGASQKLSTAITGFTGFPGGLLITVAAAGGAGVAGTHYADIVTGTGSHLYADTAGNVEVAGSVASFDSDGVTLDANDLNASGIDYHYVLIADPATY